MFRFYCILFLLCMPPLGARSHSLELTAERLSMQLDWDGKHVRLASLRSLPSGVVLTSAGDHPLFTLKIRCGDGEVLEYNSLTGWQRVEMQHQDGTYLFTFRGLDDIAGGEAVSVSVRIDGGHGIAAGQQWYESSAITLTWDGSHFPKGFSLEEAVLLPLSFRRFGGQTQAFYPYSSGIVCDPFSQEQHIMMNYPAGFGASMAWFALWDDAGRGVYVGAHDKTATWKHIGFDSDTDIRKADIVFRYPAVNLGQDDSGFAPCRIVITGFEGDWYDAALLYRDWVRNESEWYPRERITENGRSDTPQWMKELSVWAMGSEKDIERFQQTFGIPVGFHWYNWHQIPFDNDYPHYFPAKEGFKERVAEIQRNDNIYVMPYINGRLWDRLDEGLVDSLFTAKALPGVVKYENGDPCLETYGSREADGRDVYLGVMCPSSEVWRSKLDEIVRRLTRSGVGGDQDNFGVKAVYIDQIAAAPPRACFDRSHPHPVGGGDWWVSSYRDLMLRIRSGLPDGAALTTESNADGYTGMFDGFLVWQFQHNGQVPAFAAVYGGSIQLFGRGYDGDGSALASRLKLAESFVFGEQIGWISTAVLDDPERLEFMKKVVSLRHTFREYFYKGEMSRPPGFSGDNPRLEAAWFFVGRPSVVTVDAVRSGAWRIPDQKKAILMFANGSDRSCDLKPIINLRELGFESSDVRIVRHNPDGSKIRLTKLPDTLHFAPEEAFVIEIQ